MDLRSIGDPAAWLRDLFSQGGGAQYGGERISQLQHALQCAQLADNAGAAPGLICAALLHDVGHLLHQLGEAPAERGLDDRHEAIGGGILAKWFPADVSEPVRLHVAAKQYLCATDPGYHDRLSAASKRSLHLQGGAFNAADACAFHQLPFADDAVRLRQWDEAAKVPGLETHGFNHYLPLMSKLLLPAAAARA